MRSYLKEKSARRSIMQKVIEKVLAGSLALIMLIGMFPPMPVSAEENTAVAASSANTVAYSDSVVRAAFTDETIRLNGQTNEKGWSLLTAVGTGNSIGAQWDTKNLYIAVRSENKEAVTFTLNGTKITNDNSDSKTSTNKKCTEYKIALKTLGVSATDFGEKINAEFTIGKNTWKGTIVLSGIDWISADNASRTATRTSTTRSGTRIVHPTSRPTENQGSNAITAGYTYFDLYTATGHNPDAVHTRSYFMGEEYALLSDRSASTVFEFDFTARSMPVYKMGEMADFYPYYPSRGFIWDIHDSSSETDAGGYTFAINNTDGGLIFQAFTAEKTVSHYLNKKLGDTFRIGMLIDPEGNITLYVDGVEAATFTKMRFENSHFADTGYAFGIMRNATPAASAADNFDLDVTNVAVGKYYGESVIDGINFSLIQRDTYKNFTAHEVTAKLSLPSEFKHELLGTKIPLTWTSSDPSVIDPATGNVTRPAADGKLVTLTATAASLGASKEIEVYVKGLAPSTDVLVAKSDLATHKGAGEALDVYEFVFDEKNNSIIRDLGETKTVNVIALKDGDDVCRLNESLVTIWTSDDNVSYTQVPAFKLLRAGEYTYLYNFEAAARYIKVHCTSHYSHDADFIGPLHDMINAYYEDVFGGNGSAFATESSVTLKNDTDTAQFDTVSVLSPADAGVSCLKSDYSDVRFYLNGDLLYHFFDGENFQVRVPKLSKNSSVTLKVLSGNADAMDIANKENVFEVIYGTKETYTYSSRWWIELPNGNLMAFVNVGQRGTAFVYRISTDQGRTWSGNITATGSYDYLCVPQGQIYDEDSGRILVTGFTRIADASGAETGLTTRYMYSDDMGRTWKKAPLTVEGYDSDYILSYATIIKVSQSYDGEDGPGVDFLHVLGHESPTMSEYYDNGYGVSVGRVAYTTDCGKTWTLSPDEIGYYDSKSDIPHIREMGISEQNILEAPNGDIVMYARCQFEDVYKLGYAVSKDHGITWSDVELSEVYSVNTQPMLFDYEDYKFIMWNGNNMFGGGSYRRDPLVVGYFLDDELREVYGIQDMLLNTGMYGVRVSEERDGTNPQIVKTGNSLLTAYSYRTIRVDNYLDYFFKTKGAYDSFEQKSTKYEGWANDGGEMIVSSDFSTDGERSMLMKTGSAGRRSIPYLQNGTVSFDIYVSDVSKAKFEFELESASSRKFGEAAPIALHVEGSTLSFYGSNKTAALDLKTGWNSFKIDLALADATPAASVSVNSGTPIEIPVNIEVGDYACYAHMTCLGTLDYYLDAFYINDTDASYIPDIVVSAEASPLTEVPESLAEAHADVSALTSAMQEMLLTDAGEGYTAENTAVYALSPIISRDGGDTWSEATEDDIPAAGMSVKIDYPNGTSSARHSFIAMTSDGKSLKVTKEADALYLQTDSLAPVIVAWEAAPNAGASPLLWIGIGVGVAAVVLLVVALTVKPKKKEN